MSSQKHKVMDEYEQIEMIKDRRWTNTLKCDIFENIVKLGKVKEYIRRRGMKSTLKNEKLCLNYLRNDLKKHEPAIKEINNNFKDKILSGINDRSLVKRFKYLDPNGIKSSISRSIFKIGKKTNLLIVEINKKKIQLRRIHNRMYKLHTDKSEHEDIRMKEILSKIASMEKKIALVDLNNRKTSEMVDSTKQNLNMYDKILEQLRKDSGEMAINIMKEIEIGTYFKKDAANYIQNFIDEKTENEKFINKEMFHIDQLNSIMDSLEHTRYVYIHTIITYKVLIQLNFN